MVDLNTGIVAGVLLCIGSVPTSMKLNVYTDDEGQERSIFVYGRKKELNEMSDAVFELLRNS